MSEISASGSLTPKGNSNGGLLFNENGIKINIRSSTHFGPYYLSDAGRIQFYKHDKPTEFYGKEACLVRNETVKGVFVVRVPEGTPFQLLFRYRDLFEERQAAVERQLEYKQSAPYKKEREVGVNCGYATIVAVQDPLVLPAGFELLYNGTPLLVENNNGKVDFWVLFAGDNTKFPVIIKRIRDYFETSVDGEVFKLVGNAQGNGGQDGFFDDPNHPLYNIREYPSLRSRRQAVRLLGENSGGYGHSSLIFDQEDNGAHGGDAGTAMNFEPTRRIGPCFDDGVGYYTTPGGMIVERPLVLDNFKANPANGDLPPRHLDKKTNALYKTEMCRNWNEVGDCRYGRSCQFAHGQKELRVVARHGQWKTKTCMAWLHGGCTYGSRCCYAHEVVSGGSAKGESSTYQEPRGSPGSSEDSHPGQTDFCGGHHNHV